MPDRLGTTTILFAVSAMPKPANEVGRAVDAAEAIENRSGLRQVVDQHHGSRAISAGIKADARPLPEHAQISCISCIQHAVAIAEATDEGTAGLLTENIAVWQSPLAHRFLDNRRKPV